MRLTVEDIYKGHEDTPKALRDAGITDLAPDTEIIRKATNVRIMRFEENEPAIIGIISDLRKDRDNEVLLPEGMDDSTESGVVSWNHDYWREGIPHARTLWNIADPKGEPYQILSKTLYLVELSELGRAIYEYRKAGHPLGQSVGFRAKERVRRGQSGYEEIYKAWLPRVKKMLRAKGIKARPDEFSEPDTIFTKWEKLEHGDVFMGANMDALQIAVNKGIVTPKEAKELVEFKAGDGAEGDSEIAKLKAEIADLQVTVNLLAKKLHEQDPPVLDFEKLWNGTEKSLQQMWEEAT
jgi:hypothetical protein